MSSAEEPLISRQFSPEGDHPDDGNANGVGDGIHNDTNVFEDPAAHPATPTLFVYLLTFSAGISGLLFGCKSTLSLPIYFLFPIPSLRQC